MTNITTTATNWIEAGLVPDPLIRLGIRHLLNQRQAQITALLDADKDAFVDMMDRSAIAVVPQLANEQHYEVPAEFFAAILGEYRKYSCCHWDDAVKTLDEAEKSALKITCRRAEVSDGMKILDLGCGWGSLSLWIAKNFPNTHLTSVSNSTSQKTYIDARAEELGISNIRVITADMNDFSIDERFDRIVSVEMFEHMRNYRALFARISQWLTADGLFFMHIFCHRSAVYEYIDAGPADWMTRHFFSGGIMPSNDLPLRFQVSLVLKNQWQWNGHHYKKTAAAWLKNMDANKQVIMPILADTYGDNESRRWWARWRVFFLAVGEMFAADTGNAWSVGHYLFQPNRTDNGLTSKHQ